MKGLTMKHQLHTEIEIAASTAVVWEILTDLERYAEWNPFITSSEGEVVLGQRITNRMQPPGGKAMTFMPTITDVEEGHTFEWLGRLGLPGVFDGRHRFELYPGSDGGTRLVHREQMSGILVRPLRKKLDRETLPGFEAMNEALKARAEARS